MSQDMSTSQESGGILERLADPQASLTGLERGILIMGGIAFAMTVATIILLIIIREDEVKQVQITVPDTVDDTDTTEDSVINRPRRLGPLIIDVVNADQLPIEMRSLGHTLPRFQLGPDTTDHDFKDELNFNLVAVPVQQEMSMLRPPHGFGFAKLSSDGSSFVVTMRDNYPSLRVYEAKVELPENTVGLSGLFAHKPEAGLYVRATGDDTVFPTGSDWSAFPQGLGTYGTRSLSMSVDGLRLYAGWQKTYQSTLKVDTGSVTPALQSTNDFDFGYMAGQISVWTRTSTKSGLTVWETEASSIQWTNRYTERLNPPPGDLISNWSPLSPPVTNSDWGAHIATSYNPDNKRQQVASRCARGVFESMGPVIWVIEEIPRDATQGFRKVSGALYLPENDETSGLNRQTFGHAFDLGNDTVLASVDGKIAMFNRDAKGVWSFGGLISHPVPADGEMFGTSIRISQQTFDLAIVGSPVLYNGSNSGGSVFLLSRGQDGLWIITDRMTAPTGFEAKAFGHWVSCDRTFRMLSASARQDNRTSSLASNSASDKSIQQTVDTDQCVILFSINQKDAVLEKTSTKPVYQHYVSGLNVSRRNDPFFGCNMSINSWKNDPTRWVVLAGEPYNHRVKPWYVQCTDLFEKP